MRRRPSFTVSLVALFVPLVSGLGLLVGWLGYQRSAELLSLARNDTLEALVGELRTDWSAQSDPRLVMAGLDELTTLAGSRTEAEWRAALPLMQRLLARTPRITAYHLARPDGSLFRVKRVGPQSSVEAGRLPEGSAYLVEAIVANGARRLWLEAFDGQLRSLGPVQGQDLQTYDPRQRPCYQLAQKGGGSPVVSPVHRLQLSGGLGVTISRQLPGGGAVGALVLLHNLEASLAELRLTPSTELALVDGEGRLLLTPGSPADEESLRPLAQARQPVLAAMAPLVTAMLARPPAGPSADGRTIELKTFQVRGQTW
ncbi:MAG: hypothetical protein FJ054_12390 [Cyanobacteria bacterium M_surface_10_m2_119]|nr:hypothetical protein [Cyanobacteria bacterium M_surface_10_m2_119]